MDVFNKSYKNRVLKECKRGLINLIINLIYLICLFGCLTIADTDIFEQIYFDRVES